MGFMMRFEMCLFGLPLLFLFVLTPPAAACPYPCSCTNFRVDCYDKNIKEIPDSFPADVISIDLQYNQIESVGDQFQNLSSLQEVMLRFNRISHLPHGAFSNLPNLRHVNMGSNHIVNLTSDVFQNVPKLVVLDLTDNFLTSLDGAFENLSNLTKVVLTRNNIQQLTEEGLKPLTKLMYLMADENQIDSVSPTAFSSLKELSYVSLHSNPLPDMDNVFSQNDLLSYLDLSNCQLPAVPAGLPWATRHLRLSGNNITKILKDTFMSTRFLGVIRLDGNQITEIQPDAFMPIAHLQEIWLDGNQLTSVPSQIPVTVKTLSIKNNNIKELSHEHFPANSKLSLLSLSGNQITSIAPFTFSRLTSLLQLHLSGNQIAELRNKGLAGMRNLTELDLSRNPISHIDTRFAAGLSKLKTLDLSYVDETEPNLRGNFFRDIPVLRELNLRRSSDLAWNILTSNETLASFYNLHRLDIRDNQFATLSTDLPRFFPNIQSVKLAENAWVCDQQLLWLHDWMKTKREVFEDAGEVVCAAPQHLVGAIIADLPFHAFFHTTTLPTTTTVTEVDIETGSGDEAELTTVEQKWIETTAPEIQPTLTPAETDVTTTFWDSERTTEDSGVTTGGPPTGSGWTTEDGSHQKESTSATVPVTSEGIGRTSTSSVTTSSTIYSEKSTQPSGHTSPLPKHTSPTPASTLTTASNIPFVTPTPSLPTTTHPQDTPGYGESRIKSASATSTPHTIIIIAIIAAIALIAIVIATVLIVRHRRQIQMRYHRVVCHKAPHSDTMVVLSDQDEPASVDPDASPMTDLSKTEEGSMGSRVENASDDSLHTRLV